MYWLRIARKAKLYRQPEYPNLEALLEAEADQPSEDYRMLAKIIPPVIVGCGLIVAVLSILQQRTLWPFLSTIAAGAIATVVWYIFDSLAKKTPESRQRVTKLSKQIMERIGKLTNLVGVEPAIAPPVGSVLDEAAGIYLKHRSEQPVSNASLSFNQEKAERALEEAMAKMLELAVQPSIRTQELELQKGWAVPLLGEMRAMDTALTNHLLAPPAPIADASDPLAGLREARLELQGIDQAMSELEQHTQ